MDVVLVNAVIVYAAGLFVVPNMRGGGRLRRVLQVPYAPLVWLGLWHRWSMYAPDVPTETRITLAGVVLDDGTFEVVPLPGCDDDKGFGKARSLRFIAFQWALGDPATDYMKPALCDYVLALWRSRERPGGGTRLAPVAVELREYRYASPPPGERLDVSKPSVHTLFAKPVTDEP